MSKKQLDTSGITNELQGSSLFFQKPKAEIPDPIRSTPPDVPTTPRTPLERQEPSLAAKDATIKQNRPLRMKDSTNASTLSGYQDSVVESIRKSVKVIGKEVTFVRMTPEEKRALADIAYTYKRRGVKTSENEVARIGINYLLEDYKESGKESILAKVIEALLA